MSALLLPNEILAMPAQSARRLVESGDGDAALLYLALLDRGTGPDGARTRLHWSQDRLERAWQRLAALGLVEQKHPPAPPTQPRRRNPRSIVGRTWPMPWSGSRTFKTFIRRRSGSSVAL